VVPLRRLRKWHIDYRYLYSKVIKRAIAPRSYAKLGVEWEILAVGVALLLPCADSQQRKIRYWRLAGFI